MNVLLSKLAPKTKNPPTGETGETRLWWATIQRAALDLRYGHESDALDALEFLRTTGLWLVPTLFEIPERQYQECVAALVADRNRRSTRALPISSLSR